MTWTNWLPDLKGALKGLYEENVKGTVETKTEEFKGLIEKNIALNWKTQKVETEPLPRAIL